MPFLKRLLLFIAIMTLVTSGYSQKTLFSSTFTGTDGKRPAEWQVVNAPETEFWYIQYGQFTTANCDFLPNGGYSFAILNAPDAASWNNYSVECSAWCMQENGRTLLVGRWTDSNNYYAAVIHSYSGKRSLIIEKVQNGTRYELARLDSEKSATPMAKFENGTSTADARNFKFNLYNDQLSLEYDNKLYLVAKDASLTKGAPGLGEFSNYLFFDNFVVTETTAPVNESSIDQSTGTAPGVQVQKQTTLGESTLGKKVYRVVMGSGLPKDTAESLKTELLNMGYTPVEISEKGGKCDVLLGAFLSDTEAKNAKKDLAEEGYNAGDVIAESGTTAKATMDKATQGSSDKMYKVLVKSFPNMQGAGVLKEALENDGYHPVDVKDNGAGKVDVFIGRFNNESDAKSLADDLLNDGYPFAAPVQDTGTAATKVAMPATAGSPAESSPFNMNKQELAENLKSRVGGQVDQRQIEDAVKVYIDQKTIERGAATKSEYDKIVEETRKLDQRLRDALIAMNKTAEEEKNKKLEISKIIYDIDKSIDQRNVEEAEAKIAELKSIDPTSGFISIKQKRIDDLKKFGVDDPLVMLRKEIEEAWKTVKDFEDNGDYNSVHLKLREIMQKSATTSEDYKKASTEIGRIKGMLDVKKKQEEEEKKKQMYMMYGVVGLVALLVIISMIFLMKTKKRDRELLKQVQELTMKPLMELAEGKIPKELQDLRADHEIPQGKSAEPVSVSQEPTQQMKKSKEAPKQKKSAIAMPSFESEIEETPAAPASKKGGVEMPDIFADAFAEEKKVEAPKPAPVAEAPKAPAPKPEPVIIPPAPEPKAVEPEPSFGASVDLDSLSFSTPDSTPIDFDISASSESKSSVDDLFSIEQKSPELELPVEQESAPVSIELPDFSISAAPAESISIEPVVEEKPAVKPEPKTDQVKIAAAAEPSVPKVQAVLGDEDVTMIQKAKPASPAPEKKEPATDKVKAIVETPKPAEPDTVDEEPASKSSTVFSQDFEEEQVNGKPQGWRGDYDYASLIVSDENVPEGSAKCMRFEKKTGSGSAYYCCKFDDIAGTVGVEFDLRCDDKNKYLLGFYIERNEDFRQSIHTIIHRTDASSEPSLRIQGQSTPYKMAEWCHIKYVINLNEGVVDGYVNEKLIANRIRLATRPQSINTLSIRDNLATTGILFIDNIKIYKI